jgi:hypothetical protein
VSAPVILGLMTFCFLFFGYLGVPVPFSLMAGVFVGALLADVSLAAIMQKIFDGVDSEALLAIRSSPGRRTHEFGQRGGANSEPVAVAGRAYQGRALAGRGRVLDVLLGNVGLDHRRRRRDDARAGRPMKKEGYSPAFIAAIIAAASTIAALVPPSITAVVYGAVGNVSIAACSWPVSCPG